MRRFLSSMTAAGMVFAMHATPAFAASSADLSVEMSGPASVGVYTPGTYSVTVKNLGPRTAGAVKVTVSFPQTDTSPSVFILGNVSFTDSRCSFISRQLVCSLGTLKKGKTATFTYAYTAPVSTKTLTMSASAESNVSDPDPLNSTDSLTPNLTYPSRTISAGVVANSHCTGTNLTSYFECLLFPSSITSHTVNFSSNGTLTGTGGLTGNWSQNGAKTSLFFEYFQPNGSGSIKVAEFNGLAINGSSCFDGLTTFPGSTYVSPYRVCQ